MPQPVLHMLNSSLFPLHAWKIMYKTSARAFAIDWLIVYLFLGGAGEVILELLVVGGNSLLRWEKQHHEGIYSI